MSLLQIQQELKAPKGQTNSFGKYKYRSAEDIIEAAKPICHKYGFVLLLSDEIVQKGDRIYVRATASLFKDADGKHTIHEVDGWAREEEVKKGMDASQITGAASSYARKYALNGLFAIDDTKDSDATNDHKDDKPVPQKKDITEPAMMNDVTMLKLVARYNGGEQDVFKRAEQHFVFRQKDLDTIKILEDDRNI
jgi:hypothetical protein